MSQENNDTRNGLLIVGGTLAAVGLVGLVAYALSGDDSNAMPQAKPPPPPDPDQQRREEDLRKLRGKVRAIAAMWFGATPPEVFFDEKVDTAEARGDGTIHVNRQWFSKTCADSCGTADAVCARAFAYWLLAHEMAHIVCKDPQAVAVLDISVPAWIRQTLHHAMELRADWFAGRALARLGEDIGVVDRVMPQIAPAATDKHPAFHDRIRATRDGYTYQMGLVGQPTVQA